MIFENDKTFDRFRAFLVKCGNKPETIDNYLTCGLHDEAITISHNAYKLHRQCEIKNETEIAKIRKHYGKTVYIYCISCGHKYQQPDNWRRICQHCGHENPKPVGVSFVN